MGMVPRAGGSEKPKIGPRRSRGPKNRFYINCRSGGRHTPDRPHGEERRQPSAVSRDQNCNNCNRPLQMDKMPVYVHPLWTTGPVRAGTAYPAGWRGGGTPPAVERARGRSSDILGRSQAVRHGTLDPGSLVRIQPPQPGPPPIGGRARGQSPKPAHTSLAGGDPAQPRGARRAPCR